MALKIQAVQENLIQHPKLWLITGVAGFIGSNLLETLLNLNQRVIGLDNFATGFKSNLDNVREKMNNQQWRNFIFYEGDIRCLETCKSVCVDIDYVLHHAALGSVVDSIHDPVTFHSVNVTGFLNMLIAAWDSNVASFIYASSGATYGDDISIPQIEEKIGNSLSPYAVTKRMNELYADIFNRTYATNTIGLRYFNVFGKRQNPSGSYAAVIPTWISTMLKNEAIFIYGDGETSRDFCYIDDVVQANILAATADPSSMGQIYNIAVNERTSLNQLFEYLLGALKLYSIYYVHKPIYQEFRIGDIKHSLADISKARNMLNYEPQFCIKDGIKKALSWYINYNVCYS